VLLFIFDAASLPFICTTFKQKQKECQLASRANKGDSLAISPAFGRPGRQKAPGKIRPLSRDAVPVFDFWALPCSPNHRRAYSEPRG
jgi:hypothetical protein